MRVILDALKAQADEFIAVRRDIHRHLVAIPELFPTALRSTGTSITYAVGATVFGGTTQFVITWLLAGTGDAAAPAYYVVVASALSLVGMFLLPEAKNKDTSL